VENLNWSGMITDCFERRRKYHHSTPLPDMLSVCVLLGSHSKLDPLAIF